MKYSSAPENSYEGLPLLDEHSICRLFVASTSLHCCDEADGLYNEQNRLYVPKE